MATDRYAQARPALRPVTTADDPIAPPPSAPEQLSSSPPAPVAETPGIAASGLASDHPQAAAGGAETWGSEAHLAEASQDLGGAHRPPLPAYHQRPLRVMSGIRITAELKTRLHERKLRTGEDLQDFAERVLDEALRVDGF